jgi:hypothetical protein
MRVPALRLIANGPCVKFCVKLTLTSSRRSNWSRPEVRDCAAPVVKTQHPVFCAAALIAAFLAALPLTASAAPGGGQPSHTPHSGSGHRHSRDKEHSLHFGFGHSNRVYGDRWCASRPVRGVARAIEGWLDIFRLVRRVSRIRCDVPNPRRSASPGRRDLSASPWLQA